MVSDHGVFRRSICCVPREIRASDFKATCLALLDEVAETHAEIVVTKYGRPIARLVPIDAPESLHGSVAFPDPDDDLLSTGEVWHAEQDA